MWLDEEQLKKFLLDSGLLAKPDLEATFQEALTQKKPFEEVLLGSGKISEEDLRRAKAYVLGIPFVDLKKFKIERAILGLIPEPIARRHNIIAYQKSDKGLELAMLEPGDLEAVDFIKKSTGLKILPRLTDNSSIKNALLQYQKSLKAEFGDIIRAEAQKRGVPPAGGADGEGASEQEL